MTIDFNEDSFREYLNMIQRIIERLAKNSFQIKAWTATIFTATIVLTYSIINILIFLVLILVITLFWVLDSYYLKKERLFRELYKQKVEDYNQISKRGSIEIFDMDVSKFEDTIDRVPKTMFSISELLYYICFIITLVIFTLTYLTLNWQILTQ